MTLTWKLATRNVFRNSRRTWLTVFLIACGLAALLFTDAFVKGMVQTMVNISTQTYLGHGQIHKPGYLESNDVDEYIVDLSDLEKQINSVVEIKAYSPRVISGAMLSSSQNVSSVNMLGVQGEAEAQVSYLKRAMKHGQYLSGKTNEILIGTELADLLEVSLGDRLVLTVSAAHGGELSQELFRVSGVFQFNDRSMDSYLAFINFEQAQNILNVSGAHEVVLAFNDVTQAEDASLDIWQLDKNKYQVKSWRELVPQLNSMLEMSSFSTLIVSIIMFALVSLGLINSMFMSIYERQQEFGVLLSLGTRPTQVFIQILTEGCVIGLISAAVGTVLGTALSIWFSVQGIDYTGLEYGSITLNDPIYLIIEPVAFMQLIAAIFIFTVVACVYPAIHAARLLPSFAMRKVV